MIGNSRPRWLANAAVIVGLTAVLAACGQDYPNTTFSPNSEFGLAIDNLWNKLLFWGVIVFVLVELALIYVIVKYRHREGRPEPKHVHGNTTLEILWTVIPAVILVFIAVPTVRTIFVTQADAPSDALQVEVIGHQWWWEFRYPEYGVVTANELYLPVGRTVNFSLRTRDVIHSFWIPQMGGKRDLITNRTNYLWFTPDSGTIDKAWNGFCAEYCGASHANMKFRAFTVSPEEFEDWARNFQTPVQVAAAGIAQPGDTLPAAVGTPGGADSPGVLSAPGTVATATSYTFPRQNVPDYAMPQTPIPAGLEFTSGLAGDPQRGQQVYSGMTCIGCHAISGNPASAGITGPNLTRFGNRITLGAGLYPNDAEHLARWIKNSPRMKPGSLMPPHGRGEIDPNTGVVSPMGLLDDQQIADIVAYLLSLK
jgi:cytochrome c oxidase subunit II